MDFLLVGIGGIAGSLTRFSLGQYIQKHSGIYFPIGTAIINITGALLLGILTSLNLDKSYSTLLCDGFLGAYTTFSTFMFDGIKLFSSNKKLSGIIYIVFTIVLGVTGYMLGAKITHQLL